MQMTENKLEMLLSLNVEDEAYHTVTGLANKMQLSKPAISKNVDSMRNDGYIERGGGRMLALTPLGKREAQRLQEEVDLCRLFLTENGTVGNPVAAQKDAIAMITHLSDAGKELLLRRFRRNYIFSSQVIDRAEIRFSELAKEMPDGDYPISFIIFKEDFGGIQSEEYYSMSDHGFRHPALLQITDHSGMIVMQSVPMERRNLMGKLMQKGRVLQLAYQSGSEFVNASREGDLYCIPADAFSCQYHSGEQLLTGACRLRFYAPFRQRELHVRSAVMLIMIKNN